MPKRKMNPASLQNLRPWSKGESGNPEGSRLKRPYTDRYHLLAESPLPEGLRQKVCGVLVAQFGTDAEQLLPVGSTFADAQAVRLHLNAVIRGDTRSLAELADRCEGRAPNRLDLVGLERQEVTIRVVQDEIQARPGRETEALYKTLLQIVKNSPDEEVATAAANLACMLKGRKPSDAQPA